jgi:hypothetical protein
LGVEVEMVMVVEADEGMATAVVAVVEVEDSRRPIPAYAVKRLALEVRFLV